MLFDIFRKITPYEVFRADESHIQDIYALYKSNEEYAELSNSWPVQIEDIRRDIYDIPPFTDTTRKNYLMIYDQKELICVLDYIEDYKFKTPDSKEAVWIGLFEMSHKFQNMGKGTQIIHEFVEACRLAHKTTLHLGVIKENRKGLKFWEKQGFYIISKTQSEEFALYIMEFKIA